MPRSAEERLAALEVELGFCMRYIRACARAFGAREEVAQIDAERAEWRARQASPDLAPEDS